MRDSISRWQDPKRKCSCITLKMFQNVYSKMLGRTYMYISTYMFFFIFDKNISVLIPYYIYALYLNVYMSQIRSVKCVPVTHAAKIKSDLFRKLRDKSTYKLTSAHSDSSFCPASKNYRFSGGTLQWLREQWQFPFPVSVSVAFGPMTFPLTKDVVNLWCVINLHKFTFIKPAVTTCSNWYSRPNDNSISWRL